MRFIDPQDVYAACEPAALRDAKAALALVMNAADAGARDAVIDSKQSVWRRFKDALAAASSEKCWYCESIEIRSDNAVDHFRPKNRVYESSTHPGYWWLAFDHKNFRFSCTFCNSYRRSVETAGGKRDHFPLVDEAARAMAPADNVTHEVPLLLDPCIAIDAALVWFDDEGMPQLNDETAFLDPNASAKVGASTTLYHLDHPRLTAVRRRIYVDIDELCAEGDNHLETQPLSTGSAAKEYQELLQRIVRRTGLNKEYSATVLCALQGLRASSKTAELALKLA